MYLQYFKQHLDCLTEGTPILFVHHSYDVLIYKSAEFIPKVSSETAPSEDMIKIEYIDGWRLQSAPEPKVENLRELLKSGNAYYIRQHDVMNPNCYAIGKYQVIKKMEDAGLEEHIPFIKESIDQLSP